MHVVPEVCFALPGIPLKEQRLTTFLFETVDYVENFAVLFKTVPHSVKSGLLVAFRYLLKPLVRLALKNGVGYPDFSEAVKQAYVDVASRQIRAVGSTVSAEGIFLIASVETAEVEKVLLAPVGTMGDLSAQAQSPLPRVLNAWHTDVRFTGPYGVLLDLEFSSAPGFAGKTLPHTFTDLVNAYCPGVSPRVLLDELMRTKCVVDVGNGVFRAVSRSYVPDPLSDESIRLVAQVIHNICETLEMNVRPESAGGKGRLQRTIYTRNGVPTSSMPVFDAYVRKRAQAFADEIDDWLTTYQGKEFTTDSVKTGVGVYHYVVNDEDELAFSNDLPLEGDEK